MMPRKRFADHDADLLALIDRENIEHAVERAGGIAGVERAEHEVARFRGGDGELDRFQIAHFTDHDDIGIFAQRAAQGRAEGLRVRVDFALGDVAVLRLDDVFDRILERDDVVVPASLFTSSTSAASVVDLPEPTEPVTSTSPL